MKRFIFTAAALGLAACGGTSGDNNNTSPQNPEITRTQSDEKFIEAANLLDEPTAIFAQTFGSNKDPYANIPITSNASELQGVLKDMGDLVSKGQKNPELVSINQICDLSSKGKSLSQNFVNAEELEVRTGDLEIIMTSFTKIDTIFSCGGSSVLPPTQPKYPAPCDNVGQYTCNPCDHVGQHTCNPCDVVGQYDKNPCNDPCGYGKDCHSSWAPYQDKVFKSYFSTGHKKVETWIKFYGKNQAKFWTSSGSTGTLTHLNYSSQSNKLSGQWKNYQGQSGWFTFTFSKHYAKTSFHGAWGIYKYGKKVQQGYWEGSEANLHSLPHYARY
jgi:hypothetical protein